MVGGGWTSPTEYVLNESYPSADNSWVVTIMCRSSILGTCNAGNLTVYAICAKP